MLETLLGISVIATPTDLALLATLVSIIVEILKQIVPKSFPTAILATIVSLTVTILVTIAVQGIAFSTIVVGIFAGFMVAFVATNGFNSLKELWERFSIGINKDNTDDDQEVGNG